jgi:hypothetical protein
MPPQFGPLVYIEEFMPLVERAIQEADVVVIDHWRTIRAMTRPFTCYYYADGGPEVEQDHPVSSRTAPTPNLSIETLDRAGSDVSRASDRRSKLLSAFRTLQYPFQDWGVESNSARVSGLACLELREEKFIPREESSDEESDDED